MNQPKKHTTEIWTRLELCRADRLRICDFFVSELGIPDEKVVRRMHLTVYHSRRPMPGVVNLSEKAHVVLPAEDTRFMVMAPGGENPRPELHPGYRKVGIRIKRASQCFHDILEYRKRLLQAESNRVLGNRKASTHTRSAFGARWFQAHMSVLLSGSGIQRDLTPIGTMFRKHFREFTFDQYRVIVVDNKRGE